MVGKPARLVGQAQQTDRLALVQERREQDIVHRHVAIGEKGRVVALGKVVVVYRPAFFIGFGPQAPDGHGEVRVHRAGQTARFQEHHFVLRAGFIGKTDIPTRRPDDFPTVVENGPGGRGKGLMFHHGSGRFKQSGGFGLVLVRPR